MRPPPLLSVPRPPPERSFRKREQESRMRAAFNVAAGVTSRSPLFVSLLNFTVISTALIIYSTSHLDNSTQGTSPPATSSPSRGATPPRTPTPNSVSLRAPSTTVPTAIAAKDPTVTPVKQHDQRAMLPLGSSLTIIEKIQHQPPLGGTTHSEEMIHLQPKSKNRIHKTLC